MRFEDSRDQAVGRPAPRMLVRAVAAFGILFLAFGLWGALVQQPAHAQTSGTSQILTAEDPDNAAPRPDNDAAIWREVRKGVQGTVSIPDKKAGILVQSEGEAWRATRNGPLTVGGAWVVLGIVGLLALFFVIRGRIRIESGKAGYTIERFNGIERFVHWMTAVSFIVLALSGLNLLYGRHVLLPVLGPEAFAAITMAGKWAHNFLSLPFALGIVLMFVLWIKDNIPSGTDLKWLSKGGGMFTKGSHPPSKRFNAGQKLIFWLVVLGGASLVASGLSLLLPYQLSLFEGTFGLLAGLGLDVPTALTPVEEMQYAQLWHAIVGLILIAVIVAHIYIGSLGMEGAFSAMGSGHVDMNWAREHHNLWVKKEVGEVPGEHAVHVPPQPAE